MLLKSKLLVIYKLLLNEKLLVNLDIFQLHANLVTEIIQSAIGFVVYVIQLSSCVIMAKRTNFSNAEREELSEIVKKYPVIEDKRKTPNIESKKRDAWKGVIDEFNSNENNTPRNETQLKVNTNVTFYF